MPFIAGSTAHLDQRFGPTLRVTRLLMSAARQISPINEGATARSDIDAESPERSLNQSESAGLESSPAVRRHLPDERRALTHHFSIAGQEGYLTVGVYEDGLPGEIFITMAKQGSTISGIMDSFATAVSLALQYGVPLEVLCSKFTHVRFEPSGWSGNPKIGYAKSIVDYLFGGSNGNSSPVTRVSCSKPFRCPFSQRPVSTVRIRLEHLENLSKWEMRPPAIFAVR